MDELEYRVVFKDGSYGRWYRREVKSLGDVLKLRLELDAPGEVLTVEFRAPEDPHCWELDSSSSARTPNLESCSLCELAVEDLGLCFQHLNEALDEQGFNATYEDPWPDFHDEPLADWEINALHSD